MDTKGQDMSNTKEDELLWPKMVNPTYQRLRDQLKLESEWALADKNLYSLSWAYLYLDTLSDNQLESLHNLAQSQSSKVDASKPSSFLTTEFLLGLCLSAKVLSMYGRKLSSEHKQVLELLLNEVKNREWLQNHELASLIVFSLTSISELHNILDEAFTYVKDRYRYFIERGELSKAIDCLFGLSEVEKQVVEDEIFVNVDTSLSSLSTEVLAKLCLLMDHEKAFQPVQELENRIEAEFQDTLGFSLERGLRELTGLLNSDAPPETVSAVLESKRKQGEAWANEVATRDKEIIIKKVPRIGSLPKVDPKTHALALGALKRHDRATIYTMNRRQFEKVRQAIKIATPGYVGVRGREYAFILVTAGMMSFFTLFFFQEILLRISTISFVNILKAAQMVYQDWTKIAEFGPRGFLILLWVYLVRLLYALKEGGKITRRAIWRFIPILGDITNKILGEENEE